MKLLKNFLNLFCKEESKKGEKMEVILSCVDALHYNLYKISLSRGGSYMDCPKWLKNKKATINPKNNDDD